MISVLDYGVGNLGSILNMCKKIGVAAQLVDDPDTLLRAGKILLPGVGAFDNAMRELRRRGFEAPLKHKALEERVPLLGICLGMQMLGHGSEEGELEGLGLVDAVTKRFCFEPSSGLKIPHMGWNVVTPTPANPLLPQDGTEQRFYFAHSYHVLCTNLDDAVASCHYGIDFTCMLRHGNIMGAQFHPEKSHRFGMALLKRYAEV